MSALPPPSPITAFTIEDKVVTVRARLATLPADADPVTEWTVEHVISDGEGGPIQLIKRLGAGVVLSDASVPEWETTFSKANLTELGEEGETVRLWHAFNRTDDGAGLVIARGPFTVIDEATGG